MVATRRTGLREQKKQATREALRAAALRLALERGPDNVRVDDIAEAAGVSPRTYNNYFSSREQAIVAAVAGEREARVAAAVAGRPDSVGLADAVVEAVVDQYTASDAPGQDALLLITTRPALRHAFIDTTTAIERPLTEAIAERLGDGDPHTARVLAASVAAAVRVAIEQWLQTTVSSFTAGGLVVPAGSLPDLLRATLAPLTPALDAAEQRALRHRHR
ncbi:TetR/AcrR family transcriptional regulator [Microbispora triticiradicis]|uniref:TetR/AcrR family transcriptional regulator n=1 Tax=Microbispora triticiradicis TaxID=2200763 RepID=UPI001AD6CA97|nr:TetR family transcriptional regulator [Microbispora triticiradicis]MBO4269361.1 TetR family transcriptional regulator [Microbispora triticiradicis]